MWVRWAGRKLRERLFRGTPVAGLDRTAKALMIDAILASDRGHGIKGLDVLDIGCGNGGISSFFARENRVTGVDVVDRRAGRSAAFEFVLIPSEALPFEDASFDVVISHHVIEHVQDQVRHLQEIWRVLRPGGVCYLATPNKSSPIMRGHVGNPQVLRYPQMRPLFEQCGFCATEHSTDVLVRPEAYHYPSRVGRLLPRRLAYALRALYPSHMFTLTKAQGSKH
jgi:2-polyprenyl-3-methyl-5-hydroxy-6-metoxy-1,4-benzoquinol methylase